MAALLSAALLSAPTTLWGQATQHGVRVVSKTDVTKVNSTEITADGQAVGVDDNSTVNVTVADKTNKVAKVTVTKLTEAGTIPATAITISAADSKTEVAVGGTLQLTATPTPSYANSTITWTSSYPLLATVDNKGLVTGVKTGNVTITADVGGGIKHTYNLTVIIPYTYDLSLLNNDGTARSNMTTANCYMVHNKGVYGLPLVYGNAIKDGVANTAAYTGVSGDNTTETFPNHAGIGITDPWIKNNKDDSEKNISVKSAELLWQDADGLITNVGISGDYLTFQLTKDASTQEGNAVVAAKDANGTIVWSWHIWVTKQTFASGDLTTVSTGNHDYKVTPVNLGWVQSGDNVKQGTNTFYQWGRKDPFPGSGSVTYEASTAATIADNIKNPTKFYLNNSFSGPCTTTYYNMWDAENTATDNVATATKKTVYDPCPPGFCVPTANLYYWMTGGTTQEYGSNNNAEWDSTNKGLLWKANSSNIFFPASGYRSHASGTLNDVGSTGGCWSASPCSYYSGRNLYFNSGDRYWGNNNRAFGFPVRAVAE